jgi:nitroreductase
MNMSELNLTPNELLSTTRSVRKRLDFSRPVEPEVIRECLELAVQAPTGGNRQGWQFVVVTDPEQRKRLGAIYHKGYQLYRQQTAASYNASSLTPEQAATLMKVRESSDYLADHMQDAPVLLVPCMMGRVDGASSQQQAGFWGSILPAVWSFMLAARERGLGTAWTTIHLFYEQEAAEVLGIPYEQVTQAALIPVAYTLGTDFKPAPRKPLDSILHWNRW